MKSVLMIGGGIQQVDSARLVREAGYRLIVADRSPTSPCFEVADETLLVDGQDIESITAYVMRERERQNIAGVFSFVNLTTTAAFVAQACGLPGIHPTAAVAAQNKALMKRSFAENSIATPAFHEVRSLDDARVAFAKLGGKAMIKATNLFGGQGIREVHDEHELEAVMAEMQGFSGYQGVLIEEIVRGQFVDLNGIFSDGKFYRAGHIVSEFLTEYPEGTPISPIEHLIRCPGEVSDTDLDALYDLFERAHRGLGTDFGPVGADAILTEKGPMLIEIGPRLHSATCSCYMVPSVMGVNAIAAGVRVMAGDSLEPDELEMTSERGAAMTRLVLWPPGKLHDVKGVDEARALDGVLKIYLHKGPGSTVPAYTNSTQIPLAIIAEGATAADAEAVVNRANAMIHPVYEKDAK